MTMRMVWRRLRYGLLTCLIVGMCAWTAHAVPPRADATVPVTTQTQSADPLRQVEQSQQLYDQGRFTEAINVLTPAIAQFSAQGAHLHEAGALSNLSLIYQQLGDWEQAARAIAQSSDLLNAIPDDTPGKALVWAQSRMIAGQLHYAQGQTESALETWIEAGDRFAQLDDNSGVVNSHLNQAQALQSLGFYQRATQTLQELHQAVAEEPDSVQKAAVLRSLGEALRSAGHLADSRQVLDESVAIAQRLDQSDLLSDAQLSLGNTVWAIALEQKRLSEGALRQTDRDAALAKFQAGLKEAIALYEAAGQSPAVRTATQAQLNHMYIRLSVEDWSAAAALAQSIPPHLDQMVPSRTSIYNRIAFADYLMQLTREAESLDTDALPKPLEILAPAFQDAKALSDRRAESYALGSLGHLYEQSRQWTDAQDLTEQALLLAQVTNAQDIAYRWYWQLGRLLEEQGQVDPAILAYQNAVQILEGLRGDLVATNQDIQFSFRDRVEPVYRQLVALLLRDQHPELEQLKAARTVIESLQVAELDNFFRSACLNAQEVQIDQIDPDAAVIYPILLSDRLAVILSLPEQPLQEFSIDVPRQDVESIVSQLVHTLRIPPDSRGHLPFAQQLYDWLVRPIETVLSDSQVETLVFVPDSILQNVPMAALHDGSQYLIQQYAVALTPSLQLLETRALASRELSVIKAGLSEARAGFAPLPGVEAEISQLEKLVPQGGVLLNQQFTDEGLTTAIEDLPTPIIHLATHGQFSSQLEETFILTWDDVIDVGELSQLLRAVSQEEHPVEMLVLSACQTAVGDRRAALGLAGMAVGAGARSTVASLWQVDDDATVALIDSFYAQIATAGVTKAEALRQAQISLIEDPLYRRPYFWSAFVLVGNWL